MAFDPVTAAFELGGKLLERLFPDPTQRSAAQLELLKMQQSGELAVIAAESEIAKAQIAVNQVDAQSEDKFARRWRPFIGWVCGIAFAYHFVLQPLMAFILVNSGQDVKLPDFDMDVLNTVLWGMLGLGGMRTVERLPWRKVRI